MAANHDHEQSVFDKAMREPHQSKRVEDVFFIDVARSGLTDDESAAIGDPHCEADNRYG